MATLCENWALPNLLSCLTDDLDWIPFILQILFWTTPTTIQGGEVEATTTTKIGMAVGITTTLIGMVELGTPTQIGLVDTATKTKGGMVATENEWRFGHLLFFLDRGKPL